MSAVLQLILRGVADVLTAAKAQNDLEDAGDQEQADREADTVAKRFGQLVIADGGEYDSGNSEDAGDQAERNIVRCVVCEQAADKRTCD